MLAPLPLLLQPQGPTSGTKHINATLYSIPTFTKYRGVNLGGWLVLGESGRQSPSGPFTPEAEVANDVPMCRELDDAELVVLDALGRQSRQGRVAGLDLLRRRHHPVSSASDLLRQLWVFVT